MNYRFYNARILTMQEPLNIIEGELFISNDRIVYAGDAALAAEEKSNYKFDREIDVQGNLIMPGFKNSHTHSGMTFIRSLADDLPVLEWLQKSVFPLEAKLTPDDIYHFTKIAILEYLTSGITSVFEMYLTPDSIAQACEDMGMRCVQTGSVNNFSQSVELLEEWYLKHNKEDSLNSFIPGFHAEYTCDESLLKDLSSMAHKYKAPMFMHNSESSVEVNECIARNGMTPTAYLDKLGIFDFGGGSYHCVCLSEDDIEIFKKRKLSVITNPASNLKLASGIAPCLRYNKEGINVAIGTDGPASNNCLDMFREMFLVSALAKVTANDAAALPAYEVLKMATVNGAKAMNLMDCDVLAAGKKADLIVIDLKQPNMQPINNIISNIVYSGSKSNVMLTMINGKILYEKGEFFVGEDIEKIYSKAEVLKKRIVG